MSPKIRSTITLLMLCVSFVAPPAISIVALMAGAHELYARALAGIVFLISAGIVIAIVRKLNGDETFGLLHVFMFAARVHDSNFLCYGAVAVDCHRADNGVY